MKILIACISFGVLASILAACVPENVIGEYVSKSGSVIEIKEGGEVFWIHNPDASDEAQFLGIASVDRKNKSAYLVMQSTNRWIGTNFKFNDEFERIWVEWKRIDGGEIGNRDIEYIKRSS